MLLPADRVLAVTDLNQIIESVIPAWQRAEFLFMETAPQWAPAVQNELSRLIAHDAQLQIKEQAATASPISSARCESISSTRTLYQQVRQRRCDGIVLIVEDQMRDALLFLGRLTRLCKPAPPVLVVIPHQATMLMPLLLESGAASVLQKPVSDLTITDWCWRATQSQRHRA